LNETLLLRKNYEVFAQLKCGTTEDEVRADDCTAYMWYVVNFYDKLQEHTFFLHADPAEHIPHFEALPLLILAAVGGYVDYVPFVHLSINLVKHACARTEAGARKRGVKLCLNSIHQETDFERVWKAVMGSSIAPSLEAGDVSAYCCVQ